MARQGIDEIRLEVEVPTDGLPNLVANPSGDKGAWNWETPVANTTITEWSNTSGPYLRFETTPSQACYWRTEFLELTAGKYVSARFDTVGGTSGYKVKVRFEFYNSSKVLLSSGAQSGDIGVTAQTNYVAEALTPANTAYVKLRFDFYNGSGGNPGAVTSYSWRKTMVTYADTSGGQTTSRTNLMPNPSFETNTTGWVNGRGGSNVEMGRTTTYAEQGTYSLYLKEISGGQTANHLEAKTGTGTSGVALSGGGKDYTFRYAMRPTVSGRKARTAIVWYTSSGAYISGVYKDSATLTANAWTTVSGTYTAPSNAAYACVDIVMICNSGSTQNNEYVYIDGVMLEQASSLGTYIEGTVTSTSADYAYAEPNDWRNILGPTHSLEITRAGLDVGLLNATVLDALLDPAVSDDIRPGKQVRVRALVEGRSPDATETNYAASGTATLGPANTPHVTYVPSNAIDGDTATYADGGTDDTYITIDLGAVYTIDTVEVFHYWQDGRTYYGTKTEVSEDGTDWFVLHDSAIAGTYTETSAGRTYTMYPRSVRYVRDHTAGSTVNTSNHWNEIRAYGASSYEDVWESLFEGKLTNAKVTYDKEKAAGAVIETRIDVQASDNMAHLANQGEVRGVATIADLPYLTEGKGAPWSVNGSGAQVPSATIVSYNENASIVDQVAIARDSALGYAWLDRNNILQVWDNENLASSPKVVFTDIASSDPAYTSYSEIDVDFDTESCINDVLVNWLRYDVGTGATEEIPYGPYQDAASIKTWGAHSRTFVIGGATESSSAIQSYAEEILARNGTPQIRCRRLVMPVRDAKERLHATTLDLYSPIGVVYDTKVDSTLRITGIKHTIVADPSKKANWTVEYTFDVQGSVAQPTWTPSPPFKGTTQATALFNDIRTVNIHADSTADANYSSGNEPALRVGEADADHLRIDGNEIIAMDNDTTAGTLYLNQEALTVAAHNGGSFRIGSGTTGQNFKAVKTGSAGESINGSGQFTLTHNLGSATHQITVYPMSHYGTPTVVINVSKGTNSDVFEVRKTTDGSLITSQTRTFAWIGFAT